MAEYILRCPQLAKGQSCPPCDELAALNQEISEAEVPLDTLNAKRPSIYGRMNHAHDPLTSKLPVEVVSKIFTYFLPRDVAWDYGVPTLHRPPYYPRPSSRRTTPFLLGAVCVAWRAIAWSTRRLWSSISVNLSGIKENHVDIVRDWLWRSGGCPLYIEIYTIRGYSSNSDLEEKVLKSFWQCSDRWFYLALDKQLKFIPHTNFAHAVMLNNLRITTGGSCGTETDLGMNPNIRKLYLDYFEVGRLANVHWNRLSYLYTSFGSINTCFETFSKASFLTHASLRILSNDDADITQNEILQHNHLSFLFLMDWNNMNTFLPMVQFPALKHLFIYSCIFVRCQIDLGVLADLLQRSHCSLKFLRINVTHREFGGELELVQFLAQIPSLETLELERESDVVGRRLSITSSHSVDHLLTMLSTTAFTQGTDLSRPTFLPNLKDLVIRGMELSWNRVLDMILAHSNKGSNPETPQTCDLYVLSTRLAWKAVRVHRDGYGSKASSAIKDSFAAVTIVGGFTLHQIISSSQMTSQNLSILLN
ncbi:hypothetical protein BJ912DRAFT_1046574 [Pholiota molesta]|nr:hypothetical protein BJ912DRAFT_1046574 [Pholiota molesta]